MTKETSELIQLKIDSTLTKIYENYFLKMIVEKKQYFNLIENLKIDFFNHQSKRQVLTVIKMLSKHGKIVSYKSILLTVKQNYPNDTYKSVSEYLKRLRSLKWSISKDDEQLIIDSVKQFIKLESLKDGVALALTPLEEGNVGLAEEQLMLSLHKSTETDSDGLFYFEDPKSRYDKLVAELGKHKKERILRTLLPSLDMHLSHGGFWKTHLVLIGGVLGTGKSSFLVHLTKVAIMQEWNCVYISLEMSTEEVCERFDSSFSGVSSDELVLNRKNIITNIETLRKTRGNRLFITSLSSSSTSVFTIKRLLRLLRVRGFKTDVVIVDGADYLSPTSRTGNAYWDAGNPYVDLKGLAKEDDVLVLADLQIHREATKSRNNKEDKDRKFYRTEDVAHSYLRPMIANTVITLKQDEKDHRDGIIFAYIAKQRGGKKFKTAKLKVTQDKFRYKSLAL